MLNYQDDFVDQADGLRRMGFTSFPDSRILYAANLSLRSYALQDFIDQANDDTHLILDATHQGVVFSSMVKATTELCLAMQDKQDVTEVAQRLQKNILYVSAARTLNQVTRGILSLNEVLNFISEDKIKVGSILILSDQRPFANLLTWCSDRTKLTVCIDKHQETLMDAYAIIKNAQAVAPWLALDFWSSRSDQQALQKFITISRRLLADSAFADNSVVNT